MQNNIKAVIIIFFMLVSNNSYSGLGDDWGQAERNRCQSPNKWVSFATNSGYRSSSWCESSKENCTYKVNSLLQENRVTKPGKLYDLNPQEKQKIAEQFCNLQFPSPSQEFNFEKKSILDSLSHGDLSKVEHLISGNTYKSVKYGSAILQISVKNGYTDAVEKLMIKGINPDVRYENGYAALQLATTNEYKDIVKILLRYGANTNIKTKGIGTPLEGASRKGNVEIVKLLLVNGADATIHKKYSTPLTDALQYEHLAVLEALANNSKNINAKISIHSLSESFYETILHVAANNNNTEAVKILVLAEADINALDYYKDTPLHRAAEKDNLEVVKVLLSDGANVNALNSNNYTPLHSAAKKGNLKVVETLLSAGANVSSAKERTPLYYAVKNKHDNVIKVLLAYTIKQNTDKKTFNEALLIAAKGGYTFFFEKTLLKNDIDIEGDTFSEALYYAEAEKHYDIVDLLVKAGVVEIEEDELW